MTPVIRVASFIISLIYPIAIVLLISKYVFPEVAAEWPAVANILVQKWKAAILISSLSLGIYLYYSKENRKGASSLYSLLLT